MEEIGLHTHTRGCRDWAVMAIEQLGSKVHVEEKEYLIMKYEDKLEIVSFPWRIDLWVIGYQGELYRITLSFQRSISRN